MNIDPSGISTKAMYHWMVGLITPRPIAWVSTRSRAGVDNLAPFSFFNGVGANPPCLMFCPANNDQGHSKDTLANVRDVEQFAVNLVTTEMVGPMDATAGNYPPDQDEFAIAGLSKSPCEAIAVARVANSAATFECELMQIIELGDGPGGANLVIGRIVHLHVADRHVRDGRLDATNLDTVGRMGRGDYCRTEGRFRVDTGGGRSQPE